MHLSWNPVVPTDLGTKKKGEITAHDSAGGVDLIPAGPVGDDQKPAAAGSGSHLPETVVDAALDEDGEGAVARDLHGRVRDLTAGLHGCLGRGLDVVHQ